MSKLDDVIDDSNTSAPQYRRANLKSGIKDLLLELAENPGYIEIEATNGKEINWFMQGYNHKKEELRQKASEL